MKDFERKTHYKMYKSHKGWLVAGITVTSMAVGIIAGPQATQTAQAADEPGTENVKEGQPANEASKVLLKTKVADQSVSGELTDGVGEQQEQSQGAQEQQEQQEQQRQQEEQKQQEQQKQNQLQQDQEQHVQGQPQNSGTGDSAQKLSGTETKTVNENPGDSGNTRPKSRMGRSNLARAAAAVAPTNVKTGITVQNPDNLTDKVTGQPVFNVSKTQRLQYTYDHSDANGVSSDLRVVDGYNAKYQAQGSGTWVGETYANNIAQDAKGMDMNSPLQYSNGTRPLYIDEWMPDSGLQYFVWQSNFAKQFATIDDFRNNFTKADLATVTSINSNEPMQAADSSNQASTYYYALMSMTTLEGLQNATNLQSLYLYPNLLVSVNTFGNGMQSGNLWDIRALSNLDKLQSVNVTLFSVNDISALSNKDQLTTVDMAYNQITDISPLATDKNLVIKTGTNLINQHILLAPITVSTALGKDQNVTADGTLSYTTPSFIIKDLSAANLPVKAFDNAEGTLYPSLFPSSADAGNINSNTLNWYNLLAGTSANYGSLSTTWADPNSDFAGYIIQPYDMAENVSDLNVNIQLLQADGQQLNLAPATLISGDVGSDVNVQANATVMTFLNQQIAKGYTFSGLILDGTGLYSDWVANNGKATAQPSWITTLTDASKTWTILFYKNVLPWNVSVDYGTKDAAGNFTPITNEDGTPVTDKYNGTSDAQVALNGYQKDFPDYVYTGAETSVDGKTWTDISQSTDIPFAGAKQAIRMVYANAKRATVTIKDATTGKTVQTLDYKTNPELRGAIGSTSTFDSASVIDPAVAKGYKLVSDTTKNADGTSAIVFGKDADTNLDFTITLAHDFKTTEKAVTEKITYQDQQQKQVADPVTKTMTFATVTDQVTQDAVTYSNPAATGTPELDVTGQPTDTNWTVYKDGDQLAFAAVKNPTVAGMHIVSTTDPAKDLTQTTAQAVTPDSADVAVAVTYAADATTGGGGDNGGGNVTPPTTGPSMGGGGADIVKPGKEPATTPKTPAKKAKAPDKVATTPKAKGGQAAVVTNGGQGAKVQQLTTPTKRVQSQKAPVKLAQSKTELPQTNEQRGSSLALVGLALLGSLIGLAGWKKREH
ncbi:mucin-binding protein [Levilactobacillus parabrevis]|uniref:mucin-binding protein n=1 Tax=Levilactobacillus parabrevis TaxID=357278 RepID=UPI0021A96773|nr:LPXTG cell wall anchor domain-containing protein [Levilactobacillus parabrevis]MCT4488342.1 LPXTG cell wall anchor domain-containing protein [Levilactobacillus parabrevis]MCT4490759.1 LPXTG cell wall anchor domain-containing protein [Levilactobacillus parabrevis]